MFCDLFLADDPKLICRHMAEARQSAAGLSTHDRARHARSACYEDDVTINIFVIITGVLVALLLLGEWNCYKLYQILSLPKYFQNMLPFYLYLSFFFCLSIQNINNCPIQVL